MKVQRHLIFLEMILVMLPVTLLVIPASIFLLLFSFGEYIHSNTFQFDRLVRALIIQIATVLSMLAVFSLWVEMVKYTKVTPYIRSKSEYFHIVSIILGFIVCALGWADSLFPYVSLKSLVNVKAHHGFLDVFTMGSPLVIPGIHFFYLRHRASKSLNLQVSAGC